MQGNWIIVAAALAVSSAGLAAQGTPRPPRPPRVRAFMMSNHRGRIGVVVKTDASPETDKIGAKIEGVTPGGPADKAGLKVGDIVTKFNGTSLAAVKAEDDDQSGPGRRLVELARQLEPDDTVKVEFRRGNDTKQTTLVAADMGGKFQIEIPRKQKRMTLSWKVPAREDRMMRMHEEHDDHEDQSGLRHLQLRRRVRLQRA